MLHVLTQGQHAMLCCWHKTVLLHVHMVHRISSAADARPALTAAATAGRGVRLDVGCFACCYTKLLLQQLFSHAFGCDTAACLALWQSGICHRGLTFKTLPG